MPIPNPTLRREFRGAAAATTLQNSISNTDISFVLVAANNWPTGSVGKFVVTINRGQADEEKILCDSQTSRTVACLLANRGFDGTTAQSHAAGATVECTISAFDADEWNQHTNATTGVHGVAGAVVGTTDTQTLTNKTLTAPIMSTVSNTGTLTLPTSTDTLVGRATTDTLTNKTLTAPTVNGATFTGSINGAATVDTNGHFAGGGTAPTAAAGAGNGASPPAPLVAAGSTDQAGKIDFGTGVGPGTTPQVTVTFNRAYAATPKVVVSPDTAAAAAIALWVDAVTTTGFHVSSSTAPASSQTVGTYGFSYVVVG